ncbi:RHS repeat-associated core domain-containing protein [Kitasatospora sp. NPDC018058]|uniref:RHS repeat-associated core domain-containing protein n=1 Tax=Kitasatospora sp. NPDC018058 TaxID=3364025 RepID=UPI0037BF0D7F
MRRDGSREGTVDERFHAIVTDRVGAPTELVDAAGQISWRSVSTLWGSRYHDTGAEPVDCPISFPGQYRDAETGLHYNLYRYYDPETARYVSLDPLGLGGGSNSSWYVPNPTEWTDPLGLALCRTTPRLETGDLRKGWIHIDARHITGNHPKGPGDLLPPSTTRDHVLEAAEKIVAKGKRVSDNPNGRIQTFDKRMKVNGMRAVFRVSVDTHDGNNIITFFPVGKSWKP